MATIEDRSTSYADQNRTLFERRNELREQSAAACAELGERHRKVRRLQRLLDDVTTELVECNLGLVRSYTRRFGGAASADDRAEFESAGVLGLMRAIDTYEPGCGSFGQWAFKPIRREVLRTVRDVDHPHLSRNDFEKRSAILKADRQLRAIDPAYQPAEAEVAAVSGATTAQVRRVLAPPKLASIHQADAEAEELGDAIPTEDPSPESLVLSSMTLVALERFGLRALDPRELYVIVRRFGLDGEPVDKLADIGEALNLSREGVRQIEIRAMAKLQHPMVLRRLHDAIDRRDHDAAD